MTADLLSRLRDLFGTAVAVPDGPWRDVCRFDLGTPRAAVRPTTTAQVQALVRLCGETGTPLVPVGERTAYWRPLHVEGAVVLDVSGLRGWTRHGDTITVGAGEPVRTLDVALRQEGSWLPLHPDAYGETSIGSLVAMGCTSGIGMGHGSIDRWLTGLTVVTGAGDVLSTGASSSFGAGPFLREGLPDPTGLFVGAEGVLGVITEVCLARRPTPYRVHLSGAVPDVRQAAEVAHQLGLADVYDTLRITRQIEAGQGLVPATAPWQLDAWVDSTLDAQDAERRAIHAGKALAAVGVRCRLVHESDAARRGVSPAYDARWNGPMGEHRTFAERTLFVGLDVNAPWEALDGLLSVADEVAGEQAARQAPMVRTALYLTGGFVNLGMHTSFRTDEDPAWAAEHQQRGLASLAAHEVVPYRLGRLWPASMHAKLDPAYRSWLSGLKAQLDPHGILQPGHGLTA